MNNEEFLLEELVKKSAKRDKIGEYVDSLGGHFEKIRVKLEEIGRNVDDPGLLTCLYFHHLRKKGENYRSEIVRYDILYDALDCECENLERKLAKIHQENTNEQTESASKIAETSPEESACESESMERGQ